MKKKKNSHIFTKLETLVKGTLVKWSVDKPLEPVENTTVFNTEISHPNHVKACFFRQHENAICTYITDTPHKWLVIISLEYESCVVETEFKCSGKIMFHELDDEIRKAIEIMFLENLEKINEYKTTHMKAYIC